MSYGLLFFTTLNINIKQNLWETHIKNKISSIIYYKTLLL